LMTSASTELPAFAPVSPAPEDPELLALGAELEVQALTEATAKYQNAMLSEDPMALFDAQSTIFDRLGALQRVFESPVFR
jgi:hypothetical protein